MGTVGCGTLTVLTRNSNEIARRAGRGIEVSCALVRNLDKSRDAIVNSIAVSDNPYDVLDSPDIDIVVELIGGVQPAYDYIIRALENG